jgi:HAMP domain-containing protein
MGSDLALAWDEREERPLQLGIGRTTSPGESTHRGPWRSTLLPEFLIVACTLVLIWFFRRLLVDAQRSDIELGTLLPLFLAMMGLALAAGVLVVGQASRSARRLAGPSQRLVVAMRRTQRGDIAHRVHLRHGDSLKEVAAEFNKLLDWLNENPPPGAKTGTDLIEVDEKGADLPGDVGLESSPEDVIEVGSMSDD